MELSNYKIIDVHISTIRKGDTIQCKDGFVRTVGANNIKKGGFMGDSIFGDSYKLGTEQVKKVLI
jgi:hypothetical protein